MAYLRTILNNAIRWELIPKNPASKIMAFEESSGRDCFLSVDEAGRLPENCSKDFRPIVLCALETGMRRVEILGLRWSDKANNRNFRSITG
jgi:integrase